MAVGWGRSSWISWFVLARQFCWHKMVGAGRGGSRLFFLNLLVSVRLAEAFLPSTTAIRWWARGGRVIGNVFIVGHVGEWLGQRAGRRVGIHCCPGPGFPNATPAEAVLPSTAATRWWGPGPLIRPWLLMCSGRCCFEGTRLRNHHMRFSLPPCTGRGQPRRQAAEHAAALKCTRLPNHYYIITTHCVHIIT